MTCNICGCPICHEEETTSLLQGEAMGLETVCLECFVLDQEDAEELEADE